MIEYSSNVKLEENDKQFILNCLPQEFETKVTNFNKKPIKELHICINAKTKQQTQKWMESYETLTNSCYSVDNTKKRKGFYVKRYHCIHKTRHPDKFDPTKQNPTKQNTTKNLGCPAGVTIFLRNRKPTCEIKLKFYHNHSLNDPKLMKFRKVPPEIKTLLDNLFELGYKPATALKCLKNIIKLKYNNRYVCPSYNSVYNLHTTYTIKNVIYDNNYVDKWSKNLKEINDEEKYVNELINTNKTYSEFVITEDGFVICYCPPIAKRVHQFESLSSEIIFIETLCLSESNIIYLFLTPSEIGSLPLGIILTTSENISTLQIAFSIYKKLSGNSPKIFAIDGNIPENVLQTIWPESVRIMSAYHTLKKLWNWLSSTENLINKNDQSSLFRDFYNILYAGNAHTFEVNFKIIEKNSITYNNFKILLNEYYNKKELWCTCYRPVNIKSHVDTIKYSEITIWFLKDMLLEKLKKISFAHVVDFTLNIFFQYVKQRLIDLTNKKLRNQFYCDVKLPDEQVLKKIQNLGESLCFVPSEEEENLVYAVNLSLCKCTCTQDNTSICQHIKWICNLNYSEKLYEKLTNMENRNKCYVIATGRELKKWLLKEDKEFYRIGYDRYNIQIIDEEDEDEVLSNKIKLDDNFVTGMFKSVSHQEINEGEDFDMNEINESE